MNLSTLSSNLLNSPWFYTEIQQDSSSTSPSNNNKNLNSNNHTSRLNYHHHQQLLINTMKVVGTASKLALSSLNQHIHRTNIIKFSRYSTMSTLESFTKKDIDNGIFLGLCRVLVVNQYTVTTDIISDVDISIAIQKGCDCIYSSSR